MYEDKPRRYRNTRLKQFCQYYVLDPETKHNADKSAVKAGYSPRYSVGNSYKLVEKGGDIIQALEQELKQKYQVNLKKKIDIAWEQHIYFKDIGNTQYAHKWFEEHGKLCGDYTLKVEQKIELSQEEEKERDLLMNRLTRLNVTTIPLDTTTIPLKPTERGRG